MKHNTHIYLAAKAIKLMRESVSNLRTAGGRLVSGTQKRQEREAAKHCQRILQYHKHFIVEASWAPDDVLSDNDPNHIFKLFTDQEFPNHQLTGLKTYARDGVTYYKFGGGLPFRVDHVARSIAAMSKLRDYNDQFDLKQIMYHYLLLSHYVVDAHVPMHCDLRDDPPSQGRHTDPSRRRGTNKPTTGPYMDAGAHGALEGVWDDAVTPLALEDGIITQTLAGQRTEPTDLSDAVRIDLADCERNREIRPVKIAGNGLMDFMIDICIRSKVRSQALFPLADPTTRNDAILEQTTREIFVGCVASLLSIWRYIWVDQQA